MQSLEWQTRKVKRRNAAVALERTDQINLVKWMTLKGVIFFAVPNGAKRTPVQGAIDKAMGLCAGVPDLIIPMAAKGYHAMALEVKRKQGGRLAEKQVYWQQRLTTQGWYCVVGKGYDDCVKLISDYLGIK